MLTKSKGSPLMLIAPVVQRQEQKIITSTASKHVISGDEAVAIAAIDAGISYASSYPGTPATDILEGIIKHAVGKSIRCVWSVNEKVAYETALAVAIAGQRSCVSMKQVGLNVAADAFLNSCPAGVNSGLVLIVADDPECHSSQNKQDTRHYRSLSGILLLEPADSQDAYSMTREAFRLSESYRIPIIIRLTNRTAYGCTQVEREPADEPSADFTWPRDPKRFFIVPDVSRKHFLRLFDLQCEFGNWLAHSKYTKIQNLSASPTEDAIGILCTGVGYTLARELCSSDTAILKVAGEPFPDSRIRSFLKCCSSVIVLEEGDPILETRAKALGGTQTMIKGRLSGHLKPVGELQPSEVKSVLAGGDKRQSRIGVATIPPRLPEICKPCGYHKVFGALKKLTDIATPSDIGCNSLGGLPPYSVMDGVWAMGSSIGVACGLAAIGHKRVVAIIGDSTFYHAGIPPLIEAVHEGYSFTVLLLDNGTAAMTGGQGVPHRSSSVEGKRSILMIPLIESIGVARCTPFDPHKTGEEGIRKLIEESFLEPGIKVLLYRSQCGVYTPGYFTETNSKKTALEKEESI
jgi:indolepyruvate ferredoxin oxidoreductase, alpha subunit